MIIHSVSFVRLSDVLERFDIPTEVFDSFPVRESAQWVDVCHALISTHDFWSTARGSECGIPFAWYEFSTGLGNPEYIDMES